MTTGNTQSLQFVRGAIAIYLALLIAGCAGGFAPKPVKSVPFLERSQTQSDEGVRVTVAVPTAREARELFGISLYRKRIQPVWLEIENGTDSWIAFMPAGVDREYHSPMEVAAINRNDEARDQAEKYFFQNGLHPQIAPGVTRSGFVFTNLDEGWYEVSATWFEWANRATNLVYTVASPLTARKASGFASSRTVRWISSTWSQSDSASSILPWWR